MSTSSFQYCTFHVESLFLGIEVQQVQEVIRYQKMTRVPLAPATICGLINLRGQIVTAVDLRCRLGLPLRDDGNLPMNVVVRDGDTNVSLLVDRIGDVLQVDDELYEPPPLTVTPQLRNLIRGAYKLPEQLLLVLDTARILEECDQQLNPEQLVTV
jgi:purine-binding chemotaxis protein CheW